MAKKKREKVKRPDLLEVLDSYNIDYPTGRDRFKICCPFHNEDTPSFQIDTESQLWYCFGQCARGGDAFDFVGLMEVGAHWNNRDHQHFVEVVRVLEGEDFTEHEVQRKPKERQKLTQNALYLLQYAAEVYHQNLLREKDVLAYLASRNIPERFIKERKLGYSDGNLPIMMSMLPNDVLRQTALEAGLIYEHPETKRRWELLKGRIIFPDIDRDGRVLAMIGRELKKTNTKYLTLNGIEKTIWSLCRYSRNQPVILTESTMDAATGQLMGIPVGATCGTGIAWYLVEDLRKYPFLGYFPQDDGASRGALARWKELLPHGRQIEIHYDGHKDLSEMAEEVGWEAARQRLYESLKEAGFEYT